MLQWHNCTMVAASSLCCQQHQQQEVDLYQYVWRLCVGSVDGYIDVSGFDEAIRAYAIHVLGLTFKRVPRHVVAEVRGQVVPLLWGALHNRGGTAPLLWGVLPRLAVSCGVVPGLEVACLHL